MNKLLQDCWDILKNNTYLYFIPSILFLINGLMSSNFSAINLGIFMLLNIAFTAGWIHQIKIALTQKERNKRVGFDEVLIGIGKYFSKVLNGNIIFYLILILLFFGYISMINTIFGISTDQVNDIAEKVKEFNYSDIKNIFDSLSIENKKVISYWSISVLVYFLFGSILYFFIGFWVQFIVLYEVKSWYLAWKKSFYFIMDNFKEYTIITLLHSMLSFVGFVLALLLGSNPFGQVLIILLNIAVSAYFTLLYCLFIQQKIGIPKLEENNNESKI